MEEKHKLIACEGNSDITTLSFDHLYVIALDTN